MSGLDSRSEALRILAQWIQTEDFPDRMLSGTGRERAFVMELVYGVVRRRRTLEWMAQQCSDRLPSPSTLPPLMLGLLQIFFLDGIPDYAAVNDTIRAFQTTCRRRRCPTAYINAVLRRAIRERDHLLATLGSQPLAVRESHPDTLVDRWSASFGKERTEALCQWNNQRPSIVIRPRPGTAALSAYCEALTQATIPFELHPKRPDEFIKIGHGTRASDLPGFEHGACTIQDAATATAIDLLAPKPGERILDACASPGGKTALIADRTGEPETIVACDLHDDRLTLLRQTLGRLKIDGVTIIKADLRREPLPTSLAPASFDRILLDVPCTNTGVLRRRPDARWRFNLDRLHEVVALQRAILDRTATLLKPGGRLVYSTCSLEPEENEQQVTKFLEQNEAFHLIETRTAFPPEALSDGAYAAALTRKPG